MPRLIHQNPSYRKHRASGQAIVTIDGQDIYLGPHGTRTSHAEYDRVIGEWLAAGRQLRSNVNDTTVTELLAAYWRHAQMFYRNPDGTPGRELERLKLALPPLRRLYGRTNVADFSPVMLKALRQTMLGTGRLARITINQRINTIRRVFKWGVSEGLVPSSVFHGLQAVDGLKRGRSEARESEPVKPVPEETAIDTIAHTSPQVAGMVKLQLLTGMRSGEVCQMRTCDIDTTGRLWLYRPTAHKTAWHGHERTVYIGPKAQEVIKPLLKLDTQAFIFTPADADAWRRQQLHSRRKTPPNAGNAPGTNRKNKPAKHPTDRYVPASYRQSIERACDQAFPPPEHLARQRVAAQGRKSKSLRWETLAEWRKRLGNNWQELQGWIRDHRWHPHQLRHTAATKLRKEYGLEAAQVILGHAALTVTQIYAEKNKEAAMQIMAEVG